MRRRETGPLDAVWEFPGGKIRIGETAEEGARRELAEETGLQAPAARLEKLIALHYRYSDRKVRIHFFRLNLVQQEEPREEGCWVAPSELLGWPIPAANRPVIESLIVSRGQDPPLGA